MNIKKHILISIKLILVGIVIASVFYHLLLGGIGQFWSHKAKGSLIIMDGEIIGSELIGQNFSSDSYFKSRPSSINYDASRSGSANLASNNPLLIQRVEERLTMISNNYSLNNISVPADFVTESGSALDPHISPDSAYIQVGYISENTGISEDKLENIISKNTKDKFLNLFGQRRVNVLELNLDVKEELAND